VSSRLERFRRAHRLRALAGGPRRLAVLIAVAAGLHGLVYISLVSTHDETDSWSYLASANAILDASYSTPLQAGFYFVFPDGWFDITGARIDERAWQAPERQVFRPPGYGAYLALFGKHQIFDGERLPILLGHALLFGAGTWLLIATVRRWWGEDVALLSGLLYALDPWSKHYVPLVLSETLAAFACLLGLYAFTRAWSCRAPGWWAATGALAASLALIRAVFVLAVPLAVAAAVLRRADFRTRIVAGAAAATAAALLLLPWLAWTNSVAGRWTMSVWGEAYNLILAADGEGYGRTAGDIEAETGFQARLDRVRALVPPEDELLRDPTAHPRYLARADAIVRGDARRLYAERLRSEPLTVFFEVAYRMWFLWNAHEDWYQPRDPALFALRLVDLLLIALAVVGAGIALWRNGPARAVVVLLAIYTLVIGVHHVEARFAMPLRGVFLAFAALAIAALARRMRNG
jgi:4-amino-4-deoxy-L-arabinose transferase-like glycosyltransferase